MGPPGAKKAGVVKAGAFAEPAFEPSAFWDWAETLKVVKPKRINAPVIRQPFMVAESGFLKIFIQCLLEFSLIISKVTRERVKKANVEPRRAGLGNQAKVL
jgi:hypothetical protein